MRRKIIHSNQGFTLVEIAIVLVIIGLLVGGILTGRNLIRNTEVNEIGIEKEKILSAGNQFRSQYNTLPGDMIDATRYWGTDPGGCPTTTNYSRKKETCNGNGDNEVVNNGEMYRFWQHLANAGYLDTLFTGTATAGGGSSAGENAPEGPLNSSTWSIYYVGDPTGMWSNGSRILAEYKHQMFIGPQNASTVPFSPILTTSEMYSLDKKFDDGVPHTGILIGGQWTTCTTATTQTDIPTQYRTASDTEACIPIFVKLFE